MKNTRVHVVGLGGIGSWLAQPLAQWLVYLQRSVPSRFILTLHDGDEYTAENAVRQYVPELMNKAQATAALLQGRFGDQLAVRANPYFIEDAVDTADHIHEGDWVMLCVDNHGSRRLVSEHCYTLSEATLISGGNNLTDGTVQVYIRRNGRDITLPLASEFHPEIAEAQLSLFAVGCDVEQEVHPQLLVTNLTCATLMLGLFRQVWEGKGPIPDDTYFDLDRGSVQVRAAFRTEENGP